MLKIMLIGVSAPRSMAAAGVRVIRGCLRRTPAEQLVCNPCPTAVGAGNELTFDAGEPVPRFVFGGVPSFEESKEAITDLKEVLDGMYPSSSPLNTEIVDYGSGGIMESNTSTPGSIRVHRALRLLAHNHDVQDVIATVVRDPKVWEAVLHNPAVEEFLRPPETSSDTFDFEDEANATQQEEPGAGVMGKLRNTKDFITKMVTSMPSYLSELFGSSSAESASKVKDCKSGSGFVAKLRNLKNSVVEMATNIPKYFPNLYGFPAAESVSGSDHQGNTQNSLPELSLGTLIGLAIMVIMIVVSKRV